MHVLGRVFFFQLTVATISDAAATKLGESFGVIIKGAQTHLAGAKTACLLRTCQPAVTILGYGLAKHFVCGSADAGDWQATTTAVVGALKAIDPFTNGREAKRPFKMHL